MPAIEVILFIVASLLLVGVIASKLSARLSLPALALFLGIGMLAGSEGPGGITFNDPNLTQSLGIIALIFILFSGGLDTSFTKIRPIIGRGVLMATFGVLLTASIVAGMILLFLPFFSMQEAILIGAIVAATDAAAVFSILGTQKIALKGDTVPLLELESGSNDPMAIFLTIAAIQLLQFPNTPIESLLLIFVQQMGIGALVGGVVGYFASRMINRLRLDADGLYPVFTSAFVLFTFSVTALLDGSGFLAVYILGLVMANQNFIHKTSLVDFHDGLSWLMQVILFIALGLLVFPSHLPPVASKGITIAMILIFVARPLSVFILLLFSRFDFRDKIMISWVGLRGATPIVLATFPILAGIPRAEIIFNVVFFVVLISVLLQGSTLIVVAKRLGITVPYIAPLKHPFQRRDDESLSNQLIEIKITEESPAIDRQVVNLNFPDTCLIVLIERNHDAIVPSGNTIIEQGDTLLVLVDKETLPTVRQLV